MKNRKKMVSVLAGIMAAIMLLTLILGLLPTRARAASSSEIKKQIAQLKEEKEAIKGKIQQKDGSSLVGNMAAQGTTPRRLTDLIGSLCDLTSGSGDKGTPIIYIQGYFDNYTNE